MSFNFAMQINTNDRTASVVAEFMRHVYSWMTVGVLVTAFTAIGVACSPSMMRGIFGSAAVPIILIVAQLVIVIALSAAIHKMSAFMATAIFVLYSVLMGLTLSIIFDAYPSSAAKAFFASAGMFLALSVYGTVTKKNLTGMGTFLFMGLIGIIIASIVNLFIGSTFMDFVISVCGVIVFTGLTAYDTQKLCEFGSAAPLEDGTAVRRGAILGALELYLDFINLFLMLLRLFGANRD